MDGYPDDQETVRIYHTYGVGLHSPEVDYDVHDSRWQQRQIDDFVEFASLAEDLGYDGMAVTEHHAPQMTCPSPHLLLAAAAVATSRIRLLSAVTVLPLYHPVRVAEEAGMLDLLSGGRFELGLGRGAPGETLFANGRALSPADSKRQWQEALELLERALSEKDITFEGEFFRVEQPTTIATRPLQDPLPIWIGGASAETMESAGRRGWNVMRNFGTNSDHRAALEVYSRAAIRAGHERSGRNMMVERFVAVGETAADAARNLEQLSMNFGRFVSLYTQKGRVIPKSDGEYALADSSTNRPALAVGGTPDEVARLLQETIDESGARNLLIETFSAAEARLLAEEVLPVLRARNAVDVAVTSGPRP